MDDLLERFLTESNHIEGIMRRPNADERAAAEMFLRHEFLTVAGLAAFTEALNPSGPLRSEQGMNVRVGRYYPPPGGPQIRTALTDLLARLSDKSPWQAHVEYERLHPFMDGNGRSGRILWLWMMKRQGGGFPTLLFLHMFYYQTLSEVAK